jgi:hypothetical protein
MCVIRQPARLHHCTGHVNFQLGQSAESEPDSKYGGQSTPPSRAGLLDRAE